MGTAEVNELGKAQRAIKLVRLTAWLQCGAWLPLIPGVCPWWWCVCAGSRSMACKKFLIGTVLSSGNCVNQPLLSGLVCLMLADPIAPRATQTVSKTNVTPTIKLEYISELWSETGINPNLLTCSPLAGTSSTEHDAPWPEPSPYSSVDCRLSAGGAAYSQTAVRATIVEASKSSRVEMVRKMGWTHGVTEARAKGREEGKQLTSVDARPETQSLVSGDKIAAPNVRCRVSLPWL
jgi:hypothetical protein